MGRRSTHTAEELRELILTAARDIVEKDGLSGLSARTIARRIGYSPGTLYNVFKNLDDLILHVEARLLDELKAALARAADGEAATPKARLRQLTRAYMTFTQQRPRLWNLLFEHHLPSGVEAPQWYRDKLDGLLELVEDALRPRMAGADDRTLNRSARVLWAGVHGITSLATADKLTNISIESAGVLVDDLVDTYLNGLESRAVSCTAG